MSLIIRKKFICDEMCNTEKYDEILINMIKENIDKYKGSKIVLEDVKTVLNAYNMHTKEVENILDCRYILNNSYVQFERVANNNITHEKTLLKLKHKRGDIFRNEKYEVEKNIDNIIRQANQNKKDLDDMTIQSNNYKKELELLLSKKEKCKKIIYFILLKVLFYFIYKCF